MAIRELEERLLPITATTTIYVEETRTQTIWVDPTGQVVFPLPSTFDSISAQASSTESSASMSSVSSMSDSISASLESASTGSIGPTSSFESKSAEPTSAVSSFEASASDSADAQSTSSESSVRAESAVVSTGPSASVAESTSDRYSAAASITSAPSASRSTAPRPDRSSASGPPRPRPTSATPSSAQSASASAESSFVNNGYSSSIASESSSSYYTEGVSSSAIQTLWTGSSSFIPSASVVASSSASASFAPSSTASASGSSTTLAPLNKRLMNAYYPDWSGWYLTPENIDWSKYDVIDFAFALPTSDGGLQFTQDDSSDLLKRLVSTGHAAGKRVKLSIGGWTGSAYFSQLTADSNLRSTFVNNILQAYNAYNLDGIDIDWEYPGGSGASGNGVSSSDSANYLIFLQDLRNALPTGAIISTATQVWPFADDQGNPLSDVSGFAQVLDYILIMNYDIWQSSSNPGPNAPLSNACGNSTQPLANAYAAIASWSNAGMPLDKITLGVPAYGYLQASTANSLRQRSASSFPLPPHKRHSHTHRAILARDDVTVNNGNGGTSDGQVMFYSLISQGALQDDGNGGFIGANGFTRYWDSCSSTVSRNLFPIGIPFCGNTSIAVISASRTTNR